VQHGLTAPAALRALPDDMLAELVRRLERQVAAMGAMRTPVGRRVAADYRAALREARAELERRRATTQGGIRC
jgi:hypothetical protein